MRTCPFDGCSTVLRDGNFACGLHWGRLSQWERRAVYEARRGYREGRVSADGLCEIERLVVEDVQSRSNP